MTTTKEHLGHQQPKRDASVPGEPYPGTYGSQQGIAKSGQFRDVVSSAVPRQTNAAPPLRDARDI